MTEKTRDQIAEEYKWDLSTIYKNNEEFLKEYNEFEKRVDAFKNNENTNKIISVLETIIKF